MIFEWRWSWVYTQPACIVDSVLRSDAVQNLLCWLACFVHNGPPSPKFQIFPSQLRQTADRAASLSIKSLGADTRSESSYQPPHPPHPAWKGWDEVSSAVQPATCHHTLPPHPTSRGVEKGVSSSVVAASYLSPASTVSSQVLPVTILLSVLHFCLSPFFTACSSVWPGHHPFRLFSSSACFYA